MLPGRRKCRGLSRRVSQGPAVFHRRHELRFRPRPTIRTLLFAKALHVPDMNGHNEPSIAMIHKAGSDWAFYNSANRWTYGIYMYKAVKQFDMKFRLGWHWNAVAGDPYYALDCREDDYAWCNANPDGELIPLGQFRAGDARRHRPIIARC